MEILKIKQRKIIWVLLLLWCLVSSSNASSYAVDDFDDGVLDSKWTVSYGNTDANNIVWEEAPNDSNYNSQLVVSEMNDLADEKWTLMQLSQLLCDPYDTSKGLDDFHIDFVQTWDQNTPVDLPYCFLYLRSGTGGFETIVGYQDKSADAYGWPYSHCFDDSGSLFSEIDFPSQKGTADWDIDRVDGDITVTLNGEEFHYDYPKPTNNKNITEVRLFWEARYLTLADWDWKDLPKLGVDLLRILPRAPEREIEWAGTTTSWASGYNWSDTAVPGPNTVVTINSAASDPMIDTTTNVNVLYVDVNSGSLNLSGTLDTFSMEVGPDGTLEFTDSDANITVFGDQRSQIISLIEEGRIYTDLTDKFVVPDYNDTDNSTVIKVIESVEEQVIDWNFNQTSGTDVPDNSGKGNDGSLISLDGGQLPSWAVGQGRTGESGDHAISFSGDPNSYVELLSGVDLPVESINAWTMNAWIYMDELPDDQNDSVFIAGMGRFGEPNVSSGKVRVLRDSPGDDPNVGIGFYGIDSSYYTQEPWDVDNWQMITITCDHLMNLKLYKNGHLIGTADLQLAGAEPIMRVGKGYLTGFSGMVDDFGIWSYEMSQKDIVTNLWGSWICGTENDNHPLGDFDGDCVVDMIDLALIADAWLEGYTTMDLKDIVDTWLESGRITGSEL